MSAINRKSIGEVIADNIGLVLVVLIVGWAANGCNKRGTFLSCAEKIEKENFKECLRILE